MIFQPAFVTAAAGDTVKFVPTDKTHDADVDPQGAVSFSVIDQSAS